MAPKISLLYRIYFLYLEPFGAVAGSYLIMNNPSHFLISTTPLSMSAYTAAEPTPLTRLLLTNIAALYVLLAFAESFVLIQTKNLNIWRTVLAGILVSDIGHIYAVYTADPAAFLGVLAYRGEDWVNNGTLVLGAALRAAFLLGFGVRK
ncbi:hypothetical protein BP5796_00795 [Coleophoma crateriformis]|uniref:DUF7704 domain-containing protein n=1 Tax=Coleophoma crateriformis TaxID=565419 RepID=A0A3D8T8X1_9HELO|nr:hypothetical protein BP5796_00795 [Coleophoma crateriformis]